MIHEFNLRLMTVILLGLLAYGVFDLLVIQNTQLTYPLQEGQAAVVQWAHEGMGADVAREQVALHYRKEDVVLAIDPSCTGIREIALFSIIVFFLPVTRYAKKMALPFLGVLFAENMARMLVLYPLMQSYGSEVMFSAHDFIWSYGQVLLLSGLLLVWFFVFAKPEEQEI